MRRDHVRGLEEVGARIHAELGGQTELTIRYKPSFQSEIDDGEEASALAEAIEKRLAEAREECERMGRLMFGPHRDDLTAKLGGRDLARFGSQGQHRLIALALRLALAERLSEGLGDPPILLLDDFGSELDAERRRDVLSNLRGRLQVFITATGVEALGPSDLFDEIRSIRAGEWTTD